MYMLCVHMFFLMFIIFLCIGHSTRMISFSVSFVVVCFENFVNIINWVGNNVQDNILIISVLHISNIFYGHRNGSTLCTCMWSFSLFETKVHNATVPLEHVHSSLIDIHNILRFREAVRFFPFNEIHVRSWIYVRMLILSTMDYTLHTHSENLQEMRYFKRKWCFWIFIIVVKRL